MQRILCLCALALGCDSPPAQPPDASTGAETRTESGPATGEPMPPERPSAGESGETTPPADPGQKLEVVPGTDPCTTDADCVKAECCHPTTCVAAAKAPRCGDVACTLDCRAGTMDCFGGCLCEEGKCAARIWAGESGG
jgi:hypothetical protein